VPCSLVIWHIYIHTEQITLGKFLLNNYKQALDVLCEIPIHIEELTSGCQISDITFARWIEQEWLYLNAKKSEPEVDVLGIEYVELLNKYHVAWYFYLFAIFKIIICL